MLLRPFNAGLGLYARGTVAVLPYRVIRYDRRGPRLPGAQQGGQQGGPLEDQEAYAEAYDLYDQAVKLSNLQTRYELESAWQAESSEGPGPYALPTQSAVVALLQEYGLTEREAAALHKDLYSHATLPAPPEPPRQPQSPPRTTQTPSAPTASAGQTLGGCGDVPVWDEALFDGIVMEDMPVYGPDGTLVNSTSDTTRSLPQQPASPSSKQAAAQGLGTGTRSSSSSPTSQGLGRRQSDMQTPGSPLNVIPLQRTDRGAAAQPASTTQQPQANAPGASSSSGNGESQLDLGGCGSIPAWGSINSTNQPASPFQQDGCAESVQPTRPQAPATTNGRQAGGPPAGAASAQSWGGCGDVPVWDESLFDGVVMEEMPVYGPDGSLLNGSPAGGSGSSSSSQSGVADGATGAQQGKQAQREDLASLLARDIAAAARSANAALTGAGNSAPTQSPVTSSSSSSRVLSVSQLAARLDRWQRVLPGVNPAKLAAADSQLLFADVSEGLRSLITLVAELPGRDVMAMLERYPRLLWADDLKQRISQAVTALVRLHPSRDPEIVKDMVAEYPELIWRMEYYAQARLIDELPIEIQNMMVVADQGIGYTFRYYRNRRTNYMAEMTSDEPFEQQT